eukprot:9975802-Alexandrium_andersonii.AAC.1
MHLDRLRCPKALSGRKRKGRRPARDDVRARAAARDGAAPRRAMQTRAAPLNMARARAARPNEVRLGLFGVPRHERQGEAPGRDVHDRVLGHFFREPDVEHDQQV